MYNFCKCIPCIALIMSILLPGENSVAEFETICPVYENEMCYGDYIYVLNGSGEATIVNLGLSENPSDSEDILVWNDGIMTIPPSINGHSVTAIGDYAFSYCPSIREAYIPNTVTVIGKGAFSYCSDLEKVTLAEGVQQIDDFAFEDCCSLKNIIIPNSVFEMGINPFRSCGGLDEEDRLNITIDAKNPRYQISSNFLFDKLSNKLVSFPQWYSGSVVVPPYVKEIGDWAFINCDFVTDIYLSPGVEVIGSRALAGCFSLQKVAIPLSVTTIAENAFQYSSNRISLAVEEGSYAHSYAIEHEMKFQFYDAYDKGTMENEKKWIVIGTTDIWLRNENGGTIDSIIAGKEFTLCNYDEKIGMFYAIFGDKEGYVKGTGLHLQQNGQWKDITKAELIEIMK